MDYASATPVAVAMKIGGYTIVNKRNSVNPISFGRLVSPAADRAAERRQIIEKRKHIDHLITSGLKASGIEMDPHEQRISKLLESSQASKSINNDVTVEEKELSISYLPSIRDGGSVLDMVMM